ncbi:MAG: phosphoribosylformylglycinamidine synthase subunit PurQ, partial [Erysipelotrichaceae bacterium]|nr:phosphoribosylformylglycinamidine synthase subunit PurQ [Erysipelotrichaceae bacterium]
AIGELADGLMINLDTVPKKYEGLNGTELAISESQERMAVVVRAKDAEKFIALADSENLESTVVATVTDNPRMIMTLEGHEIVNISRAFLNTNGASRYTDIEVPAVKAEEKKDCGASLGEKMEALAGDLNICSQKGLSERFDSTIGAGTVLMPFGGKYQLTPNQTMAAKIPVLGKETNTASLMSWGFDPYLSSASPYHGAMAAVIMSAASIIAAGGSLKHTWLSFQEYFGRVNHEPLRWGRPFAALLGALKAQVELGIAAIGGKDSMSGTFEDIDVPPTLISFAVSTAEADRVLSPEFKGAGHNLYVLAPAYDENGLPDFDSVRRVFARMEELIREGKILSVWTLERGGIAEGLLKCALGNRIGVKLDDETGLFDKCYGAFLFETAEEIEDARLIGSTLDEYVLKTESECIDLEKIQKIYEDKLQPVFPYTHVAFGTELIPCDYTERGVMHASYTCEKPHVLIPVFPGTNCEYDTARSFERAGAEAEIFVIRNLTGKDIEESAEGFAQAIARSQIIAVPGGFSGGDEPDGSGKFITAFFRNPKVKAAVTELLDEREGLMLGICNGFQALIKLGLVPYGKIIDTDENCPTLTFNTIGRHQSMLVRTRIASVKSPWLRYAQQGDINTVAISHGEGRFVANKEVMDELIRNGQIATQYVDMDGNPTSDIHFNPNNSFNAVEGITSPDGRIFGKMGHSERSGESLYGNIPDLSTQEFIFRGAVDYFR